MKLKESAEKLAVLWQDYQINHTKDVRDRLVEAYLPLVHIIAGRLAISLPSHVDRDDLISSGFFGLLDAVERYDYKLGNKFETYAGVRVRGAMLDYLRSKDWISVSLRQKIRHYERAVRDLEAKIGRSATDEEVARKMNISLKDLKELIKQMSMATVVPLEDYVGIDVTAESDNNPETFIEKKAMNKILAEAIDKLPERERLIVSLYYSEELTLREIGEILNLSEARICQLHTKAIFRLRGSLSRAKESLL